MLTPLVDKCCGTGGRSLRTLTVTATTEGVANTT
jgi:hypothetical protein